MKEIRKLVNFEFDGKQIYYVSISGNENINSFKEKGHVLVEFYYHQNFAKSMCFTSFDDAERFVDSKCTIPVIAQDGTHFDGKAYNCYRYSIKHELIAV